MTSTNNGEAAAPFEAGYKEYNARAFQPPVFASRAMLWHWHGYKPADVRCWIEAAAAGKWAPHWRPNASHRLMHNIKWAGTACRWFAAIGQLRPCAQVTYAHLWHEYERLLALADAWVPKRRLLPSPATRGAERLRAAWAVDRRG